MLYRVNGFMVFGMLDVVVDCFLCVVLRLVLIDGNSLLCVVLVFFCVWCRVVWVEMIDGLCCSVIYMC